MHQKNFHACCGCTRSTRSFVSTFLIRNYTLKVRIICFSRIWPRLFCYIILSSFKGFPLISALSFDFGSIFWLHFETFIVVKSNGAFPRPRFKTDARSCAEHNSIASPAMVELPTSIECSIDCVVGLHIYAICYKNLMKTRGIWRDRF
jgi:hypothetical protein